MKVHRYEPADADALAPLLQSLGRELEERATRLAEIEERLEGNLEGDTYRLHARALRAEERRDLEAEAATHRRELRHCRAELESLGCSVVGTTPLTIRIRTSVGGAKRSRVWQRGHGVRS